MIRSYRKMKGTHIYVVDGEICDLKDVYFDKIIEIGLEKNHE